jgi:hypothetical protein
MILSHNLHENLPVFLLSTPLSLDEYVSKLKTVKTKVMETNVLHTSYPTHFLGTLCDLEGRDANAIISILFVTFLQPTRNTTRSPSILYVVCAVHYYKNSKI